MAQDDLPWIIQTPVYNGLPFSMSPAVSYYYCYYYYYSRGNYIYILPLFASCTWCRLHERQWYLTSFFRELHVMQTAWETVISHLFSRVARDADCMRDSDISPLFASCTWCRLHERQWYLTSFFRELHVMQTAWETVISHLFSRVARDADCVGDSDRDVERRLYREGRSSSSS